MALKLENGTEEQKQCSGHDHYNGQREQPGNEDIPYGIRLKVFNTPVRHHTSGDTG